MKPFHGVVAAILAASLIAPAPTATAHPTAPAADPTVISDWNQIAVATIAADNATVPARKQPIEVYLYMGFMHAAVYNAVVGIEGRYRPYRFHAEAPDGASSQAAAVAAAHKVLVEYSPEQASTLDAAYDASLADIPDGAAKADGIAYGELAADRVIALRADDGRYAPIEFTQPQAPGVWRPTPPAEAAFSAPWLGFVDTLVVRDGVQFGDPGPPPALRSRRYTRDYQEVHDLGAIDSTKRTEAQTETATFFAGNPVVQFTQGLIDQADDRNLDIVDSARMFAAVLMSLADASISIWYSKFHYGFWRPITAIDRAAADGNPRTVPDPGWTPMIATPPYPDWVSGYNGVMGAYTKSLSGVLGKARIDLTLTSTAFPAGDPRATREYRFGREARREVIDARVWLGIHFRAADTTAATMGRQIGRFALRHHFRPLHQGHC